MSYYKNMVTKGANRSFEWHINSLGEVVVYALKEDGTRYEGFCTAPVIGMLEGIVAETGTHQLTKRPIPRTFRYDLENWQQVCDLLNGDKSKAAVKRVRLVYEILMRLDLDELLPIKGKWENGKITHILKESEVE